MGFKEGDFVLIEYTVRVKETGNIVDTTNEEIARKENIYDPNRVYGPTLIVIGRKWINPVVEEEIAKSDIGAEITVEVPPEKAFGRRDPSKVKVFSLREFRRRGIDVSVGEVIDFGGVKGVVKSISGGRVVVDFNHPLADKTLVYTVKIVAKLEDLVDKVKALATRHLSIPSEELSIESRGDGEIVITIPSKYITKAGLQYGKVSLATDILELLGDSVNTVTFVERIVKKTEKKEIEKPEKEVETNKPSSEETSESGVESVEAKG
ncbi:MAG: peptidylprolyl isomerase [Thermoprotei archaeon]